PSATFTTSPRLPSLGTSSFRMTSICASPNLLADRLNLASRGGRRLSALGRRSQRPRAKDRRPTAYLEPCLERQQRDVARLLDSGRQATLVRRADAGQAPRHDLAALGHELAQQSDVLVID